GPAVRDLREVVLAERLLRIPTEGAMVRRDRLEDVRADRVPEDLLVGLVARRGRVDELRAFEVRPLEEGVVDEEVLRAGVAPDVPAGVTRPCDRVDRLAARDVDDIEVAVGHPGQLDGAVRGLTLRLGRSGERVVLGLRL